MPAETAEPADTVTTSASGQPPHPGDAADQSGPAELGRPPRSPWLMVLPWAALTIAVLIPFAILGESDRSTISSVVTVVAPAVLVAALCALVASRSASAWSWWLYPPIVILPAVALVVLAEQVPDRMDNVPAGADQGNRSLSAPPQAGPWTLQTGAGSEEQEAELRERIARADASLEAVYGEYRRRGDDILVYNGINVSDDGDLARELLGRPQDALADYLGGTGITDVVEVAPGNLGGAMACGIVPRLGPYVGLIVCGWADSGGIGTATYRVDGINQESAALTTREFRSDVTLIG